MNVTQKQSIYLQLAKFKNYYQTFKFYSNSIKLKRKTNDSFFQNLIIAEEGHFFGKRSLDRISVDQNCHFSVDRKF